MSLGTILLDLQKTDLAIFRGRRQAKALPQMDALREVEGKLKDLAARTTRITGQFKDAQIELQDNAQKQAEVQQQIDEVTAAQQTCSDFRQVKAYGNQLNNLNKQLEKLRFAQPALEGKVSEAQAMVNKAAQIRASLIARQEATTRELTQAAESLKSELSELLAHREALTEKIPADMYARYAASCEAHNSVGVGELVDKTCSACGVEMQISQLDALRAGDDITICPVCGRILVVR